MATATEILHRTIPGGSFLIEERAPDEIMTPEDFSEEQRQIARTASDFVRNEVLPAAEEIEAKHFDVTRALLKKAGDLGLMAVDIPEAYGGLAMDKVTSAIVADYLSQLGSFSVAFSAHVGIGTLPIVWYGTDAQKQKFLPRLATGDLATAARPVALELLMPMKAFRMPITVPNSPTKGAVEPMIAEAKPIRASVRRGRWLRCVPERAWRLQWFRQGWRRGCPGEP